MSKEDTGVVHKPKELIPNKLNSIYSNIFMVSYALYDVRLDFGNRMKAEDVGEKCTIPADATVFMSPEHFKEMLGILLKILHDYESAYGPISSVYKIDAEVTVKGEQQSADKNKSFYN